MNEIYEHQHDSDPLDWAPEGSGMLVLDGEGVAIGGDSLMEQTIYERCINLFTRNFLACLDPFL